MVKMATLATSASSPSWVSGCEEGACSSVSCRQTLGPVLQTLDPVLHCYCVLVFADLLLKWSFWFVWWCKMSWGSFVGLVVPPHPLPPLQCGPNVLQGKIDILKSKGSALLYRLKVTSSSSRYGGFLLKP